MLNSQWLETFVVLCETGHFTKAAARLNMTQPGVSQHLRKLEHQVGQPLISRDGKRFTLTPAGEAVLEMGELRNKQERDMLAALYHDEVGRGQVSVACSGSIAMLIYPRILEIMESYPELMVRVEAAPQVRVLEGVLSDRYDLGIVDHRPLSPRLTGELVGADELCLVLPRAVATWPAFADLERHGFIGHPDGFDQADELLSVNFPESYQGADRLRMRGFINQAGQILEPVARGVGYSILPRSGVDTYPNRESISCVKPPVPIRHELWLVQRRTKVLASRTSRIAAEITDVLSDFTHRHIGSKG